MELYSVIKATMAWQARQARQGYVYLIAEKEGGNETGYYKIGSFTDAEHKQVHLSKLQTANPRKLEYVSRKEVPDMGAALLLLRIQMIKWAIREQRDWYYARGQHNDVIVKFDLTVGGFSI